jgi:hypothetical protein
MNEPRRVVEILCPHCSEELELENDASGDFECPHCEGGFEWNKTPPEQARKNDVKGPLVGILASVAGIVFIIYELTTLVSAAAVLIASIPVILFILLLVYLVVISGS